MVKKKKLEKQTEIFRLFILKKYGGKKNSTDNYEHVKRKPARLGDISDRSLPRRPAAMSEKRPELLKVQNVQQDKLKSWIKRARATDTSAKRAEVITTRS